MKHDDLESEMRIYEDLNDPRVIPGMYVVARIDGRNFSTLTRKTLNLEPYDKQFTETMHNTLKHLMNMGFMTVFGYTQSDEMSILLSPLTVHKNFNGKVRKINSVFAAEASAKMTLQHNMIVSFDCRTIQLPSIDLLIKYFLWRCNDAERNCLSMWTWWTLITKQGMNSEQATREMDGKGHIWKMDKLMEHGINFNEFPDTMKRGWLFSWEEYHKKAMERIVDKNGELIGEKPVLVKRNRIGQQIVPQSREQYGIVIRNMINRHIEKYNRLGITAV